MNTVELSNAISMIDENILCDILDERYKRMTAEKKVHKSAVFIRRFSFAAAAVAVCILATVFTLPHFRNQPSNLPNPNPLPTTDTIPNSPHSGGHTPAFSQPSLDEIYAMTPYDQLFPRKILDDYAFYSSYRTESDPIVGTTAGGYLSVVFKPSSSGTLDYYSLEVSISADVDNLVFADIENPQSYDLAHFYKERPIHGNYFPTFMPDDIDTDILNYRIYVFDNGLCKASIKIFIDDHIVSYSYTGSTITAADFYAMITSAQWFQ